MADPRKVFTDSIVPLPDHSGVTPHGLMVNLAAAPDRSQKLRLLFSLDMPPDLKSDLEAKVAAGQTVPRDQLNQKYGPDKSKADQVAGWLKDQGYSIDEVTPDRTGVYATATIDQIEKSLAVKMIPVIKDGVTYAAAQNAPSLPADIGAPVRAIVGLQPFRRAHKHFRIRTTHALHPVTLTAGAPAANAANAPPYYPREILKAYGAGQLTLTGKGQVIAILIDTFPNDSDLQSFWQTAGVDANIAQIKKIAVTEDTLPAPEGEETLDVSWSSGIAPGAQIAVYATGSLSFTDLDRALDKIIADLPNSPGLNQLSISLGLGETYMGGPGGEVATQHQKFLKLAAGGVNVFVSTGDAGSNPDTTGHSPTGPLQAEYESTDTAVIAVGGTTLQLAADGTVSSETAWASGGGGRSVLFPRQTWQQGSGVPAGHDRVVPDVCSVADPNTGAYLVLQGSPIIIGGTSWSAPTWAGICALINEARVSAGMSPLPYANPLFYPLLGTSCFRDITGGSNGAYEAGPGYDLVTGLGVPNIGELVKKLAAH
ncbi:MAG: S53 family peptidase [Rhizomicrobium sp.]